MSVKSRQQKRRGKKSEEIFPRLRPGPQQEQRSVLAFQAKAAARTAALSSRSCEMSGMGMHPETITFRGIIFSPRLPQAFDL